MVSLLIAECKLNWGLDIIDVQPSYITARSKGREVTMSLSVCEYFKRGKDFLINIKKLEPTDFTIVFIKNKPSNNVVMIKTDELKSGELSLLDMKHLIKKKWEWEI